MKRLIILAVTILTVLGSVNAEDNVSIGKSNIKLKSRMMTPEALWAMGRIGTMAASPDGSKVAYQVGYYSVKQNKSHQVICIMDADGKNNRQLTTSSKSESDPVWLDAQTIAYLSNGEIWTMHPDGSDRRQLSETGGKVEGFKFSPDCSKVIILQSIPFYEVIQKNPDDLPKATGRRVTDLMYRHWDHYVESIQHPFIYSVSDKGIAKDGSTTCSKENLSSAPWSHSVASNNWHGAPTQRPSPTLAAKRRAWNTPSPPTQTSTYII